jgi:hypothetical protein
MFSWVPFVLPVALFVAPCFLSWRLLCFWVPLVGVAIALLWQQYFAIPPEEHGIGDVLALAFLFYGTAAAIVGVVARLVMLGLRAKGVRWRYAWLPAPLLLGLLIATPWIQHWHHQFKVRLPSEACLAARHPIYVGRQRLDLPLAPFITVFEARAERMYAFNSNQAARLFCTKQDKRGRPMAVHPLVFDFTRGWAHYQKPWPAALCGQGSAWMQPFCAKAVDPRTLGYPDNVWITLAKNPDVSMKHTLPLLERARQARLHGEVERDANDRRQWLLRSANGDAMAASCRLSAPDRLSCAVAYDLGPDLIAQMGMSIPAEQAPTALIAAERKVAEILRDLGIGQ